MTETIKKPIKKTIRLFEAFAGIGTQAMALKRVAKELGFEVEPVGICEIDKFAIKSHKAIHGEVKNFGDISKVDPEELPYMDLFTYSFPCQDLSISGKQQGLGEGTRSGLLYECEKVITTKRPKYLLLENVKNLVGKKFKPDFDKWLEWLESQGYKNYWQVLNAKDYGVPQNRERVFVVSILGEDAYEFLEEFPLELKLKDILEDEVEEKYFLSTKLLEGFTAHKKRHQEKKTGFQYNPRDVDKHASCLRANAALAPTDNTVVVETANEKVLEKQREFPELIKAGSLNREGYHDFSNRVYSTEGVARTLMASGGNLNDKAGQYLIVEGRITGINHEQNSRVYGTEGISPCLNTMQGGHRHPKIIDYVDGEVRVKEATKLGYKVAEEGDSINIEHPNSTTRRGRVGKQVAQTLTTSPQQVTIKNYRIRRLTPLECWRLMGISDEDFHKAKNSGISDSQLYKQAGNAIVVDVLEAIFREMFKNL